MSASACAAHEWGYAAAGLTPAGNDALASAKREAFLSAMSGAVTGVSVVTTNGPVGRFGLTVSAVASVSADPPMVLACINRRSPAAAGIQANGVFSINLLAAHQSSVSDVFAGRVSSGAPYDFGCAEWHEGPTGCPLLREAAASFDCVIDNAHEAGTHVVLIGRVVHALAAERGPLAHHRRNYCTASRMARDTGNG
ncbi:MAG: flavin reductase [Methylobacteriaceae bacterium]|nr:flavin reductase [Methylobacteriaceae bacterium]